MRRGRAALSTGVTAGVIALAAVLVLATAAGLARKRWDGRFRGPRESPGASAGELRLTEADLGRPLGGQATLVQFSSAFCAPCRAARLLLADMAARGDGVAHVELDVAERSDLVRRLGVSRTPTVLVLGAGGEVRGRASGVPRRADVAAAIAAATASPDAPAGPRTRLAGRPAGRQ